MIRLAKLISTTSRAAGPRCPPALVRPHALSLFQPLSTIRLLSSSTSKDAYVALFGRNKNDLVNQWCELSYAELRAEAKEFGLKTGGKDQVKLIQDLIKYADERVAQR